MKDIKQAIDLIKKSIEFLPLDITSRYARSHLVSALNELNKLDKVKNKFGKKPKI